MIPRNKKYQYGELKEEILKLRCQGKRPYEIQKILQCSPSTILYHCNPEIREKQRLYLKSKKYSKHHKSFTIKTIFSIKIYQFLRIKSLKKPRITKCVYSCVKRAMWPKITDFICKNRDNMKNTKDFNTKDLLNKFGPSPKCYLTGQDINLLDKNSYSFDHIIPKSKGGDNSLSNLGLCTWQANRSKTDMSVDEYINLCKLVLENNGYKVEKN